MLDGTISNRSAGRLCAVLAFFAIAAGPVAAYAEPIVSSLAGSGRADVADGNTATAAFLMPAAITVASDGTIYVADSAAHDIRRIRRGRVDTVAGTSERGASGDERQGGYKDGRANVAKFSRPDGIAVGRDGTIFVADAGNDCIRKVSHGIVSTFAGSRQSGSADGPALQASFKNIRSIAIDDDGNLYVADFGVGIRKITPGGEVSTLDIASPKRTVVAVAARGSGSHLELAYADSDAMHIVLPSGDQSIVYEEQREPSNSALTVGFADAIAIVNENTLIVCDVATNAVRLVRFPSPPFITDTMTRALAGGIREGSDLAGGLADGPPQSALVSTPLGVALAPDGSIIVADAGNRRIRKIARVDFRESVLADLGNLSFGRSAYNIAIVGNSYAFFNVLWPESIGGQIEAGLARDGKKAGLRKRAAVNIFRIDDLGAGPEATLIGNDLGDGEADLLVLLVNYYEALDEPRLRDIERELAGKHTKLLVVFTPQGFETSPLEFWKANVDAGSYDYAALRQKAAREESYVESLGAHSLLLLDAMQREELAPGRRNFFYGADHHLTVFGTGWVGRAITSELERWKPWR
jgi:DNA-binding beta-propeller fold protein YncE